MNSTKPSLRRDASRAIAVPVGRHSIKKATIRKTNLLRLCRADRFSGLLRAVRMLAAGLFLLAGFGVSAQCPTGSVTLRTQQDVVDFAADYPNCTNLPGSLIIGPLPSSPNDPITDLTPLPGITQINGTLNIGGNTQLANLNGLGSLISISLGLYVENNASLAILSLPALTSIGGVIQVQNNPFLANFDLSDVSSHDILSMKVQNNASLTSALLPTDVTAISQCLSYYNNPDLDTISPMESLATIGQYLEINNFTGNTFPAFSSLISLGTDLNYINNNIRGLYLYDNSEISALPLFSNLDSLSGVIHITNNDELIDFDLSSVLTNNIIRMRVHNNKVLTSALLPINVTAISQYLSYKNNPLLANISEMNSLTAIGDYMEINSFQGDPFPAFSSLVSIGANLNASIRGLYLTLNPEISALPLFNSLTFISGHIVVRSNGKLTHFDLSGVTTDQIVRMEVRDNASLTSALLPTDVTAIEQYLQYYNNPDLASISEMDSLTTIGYYMEINSFQGDPFPAFSSLVSIGATNLNPGIRGLYLTLNPEISALPLFNSLTLISGHIVVRSNGKLMGFDLSGVTTDQIVRMEVRDNNILTDALLPTDVATIEQYLEYYNNPDLDTISPMESLETVGDYLRINSFTGNAFPAFSSLDSIGANLNSGLRGLYVVSNPEISALPLFNSLNFISGDIVIRNNYKLTDFDLDSISTHEMIHMIVSDNNVLTSALLPTDVTTISKYLSYHSNPALAFLSEMSNLESIGEYLRIDHTVACALPNFPNLISIGPQTPIGRMTTGFLIRGNANITALPTLSDSPVTTIDSTIHITDNPSLDYCSIQAVCSYLQDPLNNRIIDNNAIAGDCFDEAAVDAACVANLPYPSNDMDGDGAPFCDDCDDNDPNNFPGNTEICDGRDNNCNGQIDEGIECGCEVLSVALDPLNPAINDCCWNVSYDNPNGNLWELVIRTDDASFDFDLNSLNPSLRVNSNGSHTISLLSNLPNTPLPTGALNNFLSFCLTDIQNAPQEIIFEWLDHNFEIACSETLLLECPVEPPCLYVESESFYCEQKNTFYEMTVCNPIDADFSVGYIQVIPTNPAGVVVSPLVFDETSNPIPPGECRTYTLQLSGPGLAGESFCFDLLAHSDDPNLVEATLCCSTPYCITISPIPDCDPCDNVGVEYIEPLQNEDECCYNIFLYNDYRPDFFDGIDLCSLSPQTTMSIVHPAGSIWETASYSPAVISLDLRPPYAHVPDDVFQLPELCFQTQEAPPQLLEIKWRKDGEIVCRDTISLGCEPACGYLLDEEIACSAADSWTYQGNIKNTSDYLMSEATFTFTSPPGMSAHNQTASIDPIAPGGTSSFFVNLGTPARAGEQVCFTVTLHEEGHDGFHTNCCNITHCIVLPECPADLGCICGPAFEAAVQEGFSIDFDRLPRNRIFTPTGNLSDCDRITWDWGDNNPLEETTGNASVTHRFSSQGIYQVCMTVVRTDDNGAVCEDAQCRIVFITQDNGQGLSVYPNPSDSRFNLKFTQKTGKLNLRLFDVHQRLIKTWRIENPHDVNVPIDLGTAPGGLYLLEVTSEEQIWLKKVVIRRW